MKSKLKGIIFYTKKIKDHDLFIKILSSDDSLNSGLVYGGNSTKKKLIYQNGYFVDYFITKKNQSSVPIISGDICKPFLGDIINDKYKLNALLSILSIINISILEGQYIKGFYESVLKLITKIINSKHWIIDYCEWLFELLKIIGYQIDYNNNSNKNYFNISIQEFSNNKDNNTIKFPHDLFSEKREISFVNIDLIFKIFEKIYTKNHLDNINYNMPINFLNFKKIILNNLK